MPPRLLVVNPNTSTEVTQAYLGAARAVAPEGVTLTGVTGRFGARIVSTEAENVIAGHSALDLVAEHAAEYDAVILAISFDTALEALRQVLPVPVTGITGAALQSAGAGGRRVGVVIFGEVSRVLYETLIDRYGVVPAGVVAVDIGSAADYLSPESKDTAVLEACTRLESDGAQAIVICGAAISGMAARLATRLTLPVFDGTEAVNVCLADLAANDGDRPERRPPLSESVGLSPALIRLLRGDLR
ncbi:aspartate/glutamate racemase family protein [uncultured Roseibium sp.]|uniref:aspartate/glutamate racemase family protein n=1 Tax=uncultured Roseibium sp. TaxID=1936171 RepID=UPI0026290A85|nr:aspartate/glutamate racemase family protein [uncultured Roseibium sp.]